jgi:hypothetical protein
MKEINRRDFVKMTGTAAVGLALSQFSGMRKALAHALSEAPTSLKMRGMVLLLKCTLQSTLMPNI